MRRLKTSRGRGRKSNLSPMVTGFAAAVWIKPTFPLCFKGVDRERGLAFSWSIEQGITPIAAFPVKPFAGGQSDE